MVCSWKWFFFLSYKLRFCEWNLSLLDSEGLCNIVPVRTMYPWKKTFCSIYSKLRFDLFWSWAILLMLCLFVLLQLLPPRVPSGGRAATWERGPERKPAAQTWTRWKLLCHHHQTGSRWVQSHEHTHNRPHTHSEPHFLVLVLISVGQYFSNHAHVRQACIKTLPCGSQARRRL